MRAMIQGAFWQTGVLVPDLDAAMSELSAALGLTWTDVVEFRLSGVDRRVVYSLQGPPYLELIEDPAAAPEPRIDHVGFWSDDVDGDIARARAVQAHLEVDGREQGLPMVQLRGGATSLGIELVDADARALLTEYFGLSA
jgi:hypothetical protein